MAACFGVDEVPKMGAERSGGRRKRTIRWNDASGKEFRNQLARRIVSFWRSRLHPAGNAQPKQRVRLRTHREGTKTTKTHNEVVRMIFFVFLGMPFATSWFRAARKPRSRSKSNPETRECIGSA